MGHSPSHTARFNLSTRKSPKIGKNTKCVLRPTMVSAYGRFRSLEFGQFGKILSVRQTPKFPWNRATLPPQTKVDRLLKRASLKLDQPGRSAWPNRVLP
jgi:hypothetical protein